jgi:hypothetical protein
VGSWVPISGILGLCMAVVLRWGLFAILAIWSMRDRCDEERRKHALNLIRLLKRIEVPRTRSSTPPSSAAMNDAPSDEA